MNTKLRLTKEQIIEHLEFTLVAIGPEERHAEAEYGIFGAALWRKTRRMLDELLQIEEEEND